MKPQNSPPVFFFAYADAYASLPSDRLRHLPDEARLTKKELDYARLTGNVELVIEKNVILKDIVDVFLDPNYHDRIVLFHYAGHANEFSLLLEAVAEGEQSIAGSNFIHFLSIQPALKLVFLNACATYNHSSQLINAGIPIVISTTKRIKDKTATNLAAFFYKSVGLGDTFYKAFEIATNLVGDNARAQEENRGVLRRESRPSSSWIPPWQIQINPNKEVAESWSLKTLAEKPLYDLKPVLPDKLPSCPFPGNGPYTLTHAAVFWGRDQNIREVFDLLHENKGAPFCILYGRRGVGLSSFVRAGLRPYLSARQRVCYIEDGTNIPIIAQLKALRKEETPFYLFLDHIQINTVPIFWDTLQSLLLQGDVIRVILVTSLDVHVWWEEYLEKENKNYTLYRLPPLNYRQIRQLMLGGEGIGLQHYYGIKMEENLAEGIAYELSKDEDSSIAPLLQFILTEIWDASRKKNDNLFSFTWPKYKELERNGLWGKYLNQRIEKVVNETKISVGFIWNVLQCYLPNNMLNEGNNRSPKSVFVETKDEVTQLMVKLLEYRVLGDRLGENIGSSSQQYRLIHQKIRYTLAEMIRTSDLPEQRIPRLLQSYSLREGSEMQLSESDLKFIDQYLHYLPPLSNEEKKQLDLNRHRVERYNKLKSLKRVSYFILTVLIVIWGFHFSPFFILYILLLLVAYNSKHLVNG